MDQWGKEKEWPQPKFTANFWISNSHHSRWRKRQIIPEINNILYATDLSSNSSYAFLFAIDMARKYDTKIVILHAIEPVPPNAEVYGSSLDTLRKKQLEMVVESMEKRLKGFCNKAEARIGSPCVELVSKILVPVGYPPEEILTAADREQCDMIVMGTHGKGFLAHAFLGSVSRTVLHRTRKPVFIIPLPSEKTVTEWDEI
ncbi:MAG: universal stress protein [Deltaproteobacteria bacterium]|nr:universal stress protein [Deltaproteobacteria bacterium]